MRTDTTRRTGETTCITSHSCCSQLRRILTARPGDRRPRRRRSLKHDEQRPAVEHHPPGITDDFKPASTNQPGKEYPQVNSQGRVKFRIVAPEAKSVGVTFRDSTEFVKGDDGAWIGYTRPLDEGFHYYADQDRRRRSSRPQQHVLLWSQSLGQWRGSACSRS